jgi:hypothetical protein
MTCWWCVASSVLGVFAIIALFKIVERIDG